MLPHVGVEHSLTELLALVIRLYEKLRKLTRKPVYRNSEGHLASWNHLTGGTGQALWQGLLRPNLRPFSPGCVLASVSVSIKNQEAPSAKLEMNSTTWIPALDAASPSNATSYTSIDHICQVYMSSVI
ncbi:glycoprotein glucosyltransferase [Moniliophthora roreri]|nr:glycoprotein glucosyltransferase [Moniliophthora roreri]